MSELLRDRAWKPKYDSDEKSLIDDFYAPALACAARYDRTTGYFCARVLALASRGIEGLVRNGGHMRLVVGCTLEPPEVAAIEKGLALHEAVEEHLGRMPLAPHGRDEGPALELLAWMIGRGVLEVKVAVPCTASRKPRAGDNVIFHEKGGIVEDKTGDVLAFTGSINETAAGWGGAAGNWESFHVFTSVDGPNAHVDAECRTFEKLWNDEAKNCIVLDFPEAAAQDLLRFLPKDDVPERLKAVPEPEPVSAPPPPERMSRPRPPASAPSVDETRRLVWNIIAGAPAVSARVGEATSAIEPWPHQIRAFERMWSAWPPKLLIADEVGLGKTIEAGLLLRQAWLSGRAKRILVLTPAAVLRQWQVELRDKFNLNWPIYNGSSLSRLACKALEGKNEQDAPRDAWHREPFVLTSSQLMRRGDRAQDLLAAESWDLIVLDEAHHARRRGAGAVGRDRGPNQLLRLMQQLRLKTKGLVLLTATPMQVDPVEVWDLLALLGLPTSWTEDAFVRFFDLATKNPTHEQLDWLARLFRDVEGAYGFASAERVEDKLGSRLAAKKVLAALRDVATTPRRELSVERRRAALQVLIENTPVARLVSRHTRELLRRYRDAGMLTSPIADRHVDDQFIDMSVAERSVYEAVEDYISSTWDRIGHVSERERNAVGFVLTIYQKRVASSFAALRATLEERLTKVRGAPASEDDVPDDETGDEALDADEATELKKDAAAREERSAIEVLLAAVRRLPADTKARRLVDTLVSVREKGHRKVIVFTQYTDTMDFLREYVRQHTDVHGLSVMCFSGRGGERPNPDGTWRRATRDEIKRAFRDADAAVLLATDAAAEGLNFQFCGALVNYDMPWNPMRVEQRIGRIDRLGQAYPRIEIVNLHYDNSVETDVYRALRTRIGLFSQFVGKLQPILAAIPRHIQAATLGSREERDRERAGLTARIEDEVKAAEGQAFDLDAAAAAELEMPPRPPPAYDLDDMEQLLGCPELLPGGVEVKRLDDREHAVLAPGMAEALRVTTDRDRFTDQAGTYELWSPGSPLFPTPVVTNATEPLPSLKTVLAEWRKRTAS